MAGREAGARARPWFVALVVLGMLFGATPDPAYAIVLQPNLTMTITQSASVIGVGDIDVYLFTVKNIGAAAAQNVGMNTAIPIGAQLVSTVPSTAVQACDQVQNGQQICQGVPVAATLAVGASATIEFDVRARAPGTLSWTATATTTSIQEFGANNNGSIQTTVAFTVNTTDDVVDQAGCDATHCSLREAITAANSFAGQRFVFFHIPGAAPFRIAPSSALPPIGDGVTIDGTTQSGWSGAPVVFIDGSATPLRTDGLVLSGGLDVVRGLAIGNFTGSGIAVTGNANTVVGSYIGVQPDGSTRAANAGATGAGIYVVGSSAAIGRSASGDANVVSANEQGIWLAGGANNSVTNDLIGTNRAGASLGNKINGILVEGSAVAYVSGNTIRNNGVGIGINQTAGYYTDNTISGNLGNGIQGSGDGNYFAHNIVDANRGGGIMLGYPNSSTRLNVFEDNVIRNNLGDGLLLRGPVTPPGGTDLSTEITDSNTIRRGSITNNSGKGIDLAFGANSGLQPPTISSVEGNASSLLVRGLGAISGATIDVFADPADEGAQYLGSTAANADGSWSISTWNEGVDLAALWNGLSGGTSFIHVTQTRQVGPTGGETSAFQTLTPAPVAVVTGIAQCTFNNTGTPQTYVLANATVQVYSGSTLLVPPSPVTADANGNFTVSGLAANADYRFVFTGQIAYSSLIGVPVLVYVTDPSLLLLTTTVSCSVSGTTDGAGGLGLLPPSPIVNLHNHVWYKAYDLGADPQHVVTHDAAGALVLNDRLFKDGQSAWFKIPIRPGQRVVANLRNLPADYSLAMYKDLAALLAATRAATLDDVNRLTAAMSPDELSPDELSPDELSPDELSPDELSPDELSPDELSPDELSPDELSPDELSPDELSPDELSPDELSPDELSPDELSAEGYSSVQTRGLLGVSAHAGQSPELIARHTWDNTGYFYLRVRQASVPGAMVDTGHDFTISGRAIDSDCIGVALTKTPFTSAVTPGARTVFVTNTARLAGLRDGTGALTAAGTDYMARVNAFAAAQPNAVVVDLALDTGIKANYDRWDGARTCAAAANVVADSIHDLIAAQRGPTPALRYVVILGGNLAVPAHLVPDQAGLGNERTFTPPVLDDTASKASLAQGYFASYDFYASFDPISRYDHDLYLPDRDKSVGVLVESPADILRALDAYTAAGGGQRPTTSLVTGYDFLSYVASDAQAQLNASGVSTTALIEPPLYGPTSALAWSADDLRARLFGAERYGVIDWNAHFSANRMLAADSTTRLLSTEISGVTDGRFRGVFVIASGCHIGYNIQDSDASVVTQPLSFPEALLSQGATLIGSTGYGYHDTFTPKYTGRLVSLVLTELRYGTGAIPTGDALSNAKRDYVGELVALRGIDEKSLSELTLYGLPFFSVDLPSGRLVRPAPASVTPTPGASAGLATYDLVPGYTLTRHDDTLGIASGGSATVSYYDAGGDVSTTPGQPILPRKVTSVAAPGYAARGAVLWQADYTDVAGFRPRVDVATTEIRGLQPEYVSSVRAPVLPFALNNFDRAALVAVPMQYVSDQGPSGLLGTGTARVFGGETVRIVYSSLTGAAADAGAPVLYAVSLTADGTKVHVDVTAGALSTVGIESIVATYTALPGNSNTLYGHFRSIVLTPGAPPANALGFFAHYTGDIETAGTGTTPADVRLLIQAIGGNGLVSYRTGQGNLLSITTDTATAASPKVTTSLALTAPSTATYGATIPVSARLTTAAGAPLAGKTVSFKLEGARAKALTDANGNASTRLTVGVYPSPAPYQIEASFTEDAADLGTGAFQDVGVTRAAAAFTLAADPRVQYSDQVVVATLRSGGELLGGRPVVITLSDGRAVALLTDGFGRVIFDTLDFGGLRAGTYHATVTFGGDDGHSAASAAAVDVTVRPENATIALTLPPQPVGTITLLAQVTQESDRAAGDLARGVVTFKLTSDAGAVTTLTAPVSATGLATATTTLSGGVLAVEAQLDNLYFAGSASGLLAVYDTSTFITGGGSIPTTGGVGFPAGKNVNFGFNVKYVNGSTTPTGSALVQLKDAGFDLKATGFTWLVIDAVSGGKRATFEGTATLSGATGYRFRVIAQDLATDTFEIRIWDASSSVDAPLYRASGAVSGSVSIH